MVKGFAPMIREVLRTQRMPPWHADPHYGTFENARSISNDQRKLLVHWIEAGAPRGTGESFSWDNSTQNPANPDPTKPVRWGDQTFEEMGIGFVRFRYLDETTAKPRVSKTKTTAAEKTAALND